MMHIVVAGLESLQPPELPPSRYVSRVAVLDVRDDQSDPHV
jgi:hypothetical protein